ncbi:MAG: hypothetical protein H0T42_06645, partial [Deltaproteobacteria bacterium]|nr:hypothetical protein [Deltaproteobacteria bacterium]
MVTPARDQKTKALVVATKCTSVDQFVATFHRFCDDSTFFVSTLAERPVGLETAFSIQLEDKTPVLRGLCEVVEAWSTPVNRFGRPGVRLAVRRLTAESLSVFKMLQEARLAAESVPEPIAVPRTSTGTSSRPSVDPRVSDAPSLPRHNDRSGPVGAPNLSGPPVLMKPPGMTLPVVPPRTLTPQPPVVTRAVALIPAIIAPAPAPAPAPA